MALFWVHQWIALPVIVEEPVMGGNPESPEIQDANPAVQTTFGGNQSGVQISNQGMEVLQQPAFGHSMARPPRDVSPYNMGAMMQTLPDYRSSPYQYGQQPYPSQQFSPPAHTGQIMTYGSPAPSHFPSHAPHGHPQQFNPSFVQQYSFHPQQGQHNFRPVSQAFQNMVVQSPAQPAANQMPYLEHQYATQQYHQQHQHVQMQAGFNNALYGPPQQARQPSLVSSPQYIGNMAQGLPFSPGSHHGLRVPSMENMAGLPPIRIPPVSAGQQSGGTRNISRRSSDSNTSPSIPRGPPRKPRQSGHALWVGNLPPGATVFDLKEHFSREAMHDIESVFLISKSNCAFVNYKSESACAAAMARFHDSRFQGVRLVCRLRRGTAATPAGTPTGPSLTHGPSSPGDIRTLSPERPPTSTSPQASNAGLDLESEQKAAKVAEKYFVVKSLTIEDLDLSVRNGIWATQAHNEAALNKAFKTAENVFLIFSANKSGEYFGYGRMTSAIDGDAPASIELPDPSMDTGFETDLPQTIPTPATNVAPKGRIIDDSARGTIFWEADRVEEQSAEERAREAVVSEDTITTTESQNVSPDKEEQVFGKPFRIQWISTARLPFYRTRGLRNPWNANREVKIARDGTELEPTVGRRLVGMFPRPHMGGGPSPSSRESSSYGPTTGSFAAAPVKSGIDIPGRPLS